LQFILPQFTPAAVATAAIGCNKQAVSVIMIIYSPLVPPVSDALNGEFSGVSCYANIYLA